ncbi:MAG TPA: 2-oxo-4-hydroxy-4-carboxy-5-ureidoimidazoline decarboxylase, partial [Thermoanaerobaculia bacterium]|nr:2-oxo-4-hydroxy-4-carboxy-5-ureidoimidazoline decarboxylase [Thermoanaerobaculia bacterium]
ARRPFATPDELKAAAEAIAGELGREDWLEAFARHPQIGERADGAVATSTGALSSAWSAQEQVGARDAGPDTRAALDEANRAYRERFGYIFIVCASGRSGEEMLALCRQRLGNDPERELSVAAAEQRRIAGLRLQRLLAP